MSSSHALLTIGMPVYNGDGTIEGAISSILSQSFRDFVLVISDNASTDATPAIVKKMASSDHRIRYVRQPFNLGAGANFLWVAEDIQTPYFMWFACDDTIDSGFLEICISALERNSRVGMAFSGISNVDSRGRVIREYPDFPAFSGRTTWPAIYRFVMSPEIYGKANLIYSIYRREIVLGALAHHGLRDTWGSDMSFVLSALILGGGIHISPEVLFKKSYIRADDDRGDPLHIEIPEDLGSQSCPLSHFDEYEEANVDAAKGSKYHLMVAVLMHYRHLKIARLKRLRDDGVMELRWWVSLQLSVSDVVSSIVHAIKVTT